jgi:hypothetical protein
MEVYYFGGYFLVMTNPIAFGQDNAKIALTCSGCINTTVFDFWCISWTNTKIDPKQKNQLGLTNEKIVEIQGWTDDKINKGLIQWGNAFPDLETAVTLKKLFFSDLDNIDIYSIYLSETDAALLIEDFRTESNNNVDYSLRHNLLKRITETQNPNEEFLGFDMIGVERDGGFHSFYCHDITQELINKFSLDINEYGLFSTIPKPDLVREYLNAEETGLEPVPWYIAKTKRFKYASS